MELRNKPKTGGARDATEARILETAGHVFAEAGFQAAKVRDICARAQVNLAAINYHFGDKLGLYKEVLRHAVSTGGNASDFDPALWGKTPEAKLRSYVRDLLQRMYGEGRPSWTVRLMTHELAQPSAAFDGVVENIIRPRHNAACALVGSIIGLPAGDRRTRLCVQSVVGQIMIYAHGREVLKRLWTDLRFTPETLEEIAAHIATFSYMALKSYARRIKGKNTKRTQSAR